MAHHATALPLSLAVLCASAAGNTPTTDDKPAPATPARDTDAPAAPTTEAASPTAPTKPRERPVDIMVKDVGLATPESVLHDTERDLYLVSNIGGGPAVHDGNGFISRLEPSGAVLALKWIDGAAEGVELDAPKGMAIAGGVLYVADIDVVRKFDAATGEPRGAVQVPGASFLNDVAAGPDGSIYVSDSGIAPSEGGFNFVATGTDAIYRLEGDAVEAIARGPELGWPSGLAVDARGVWAVTFAKNELYRIKDGARVDVQQVVGKGGLDALVRLPDGRFVVSSWEDQQLVRGEAGKPFELLLAKVRAPADVGYDADRNRLLVPRFEEDAVHIIGL